MNSRGKLIPYVGPWKKGEKCMVWLAKSPRSPKRSTLPGLLNFLYGLPNNSKIASFPCLVIVLNGNLIEQKIWNMRTLLGPFPRATDKKVSQIIKI